MEYTRGTKVKNLKRLCIYISQEKIDKNTTNTTIDHIGDKELLEEYNKSILNDLIIKNRLI